ITISSPEVAARAYCRSPEGGHESDQEGQMAAHRKSRKKLVPLAAVLAVAAAGVFALATNRAPEAADFTSAIGTSGHQVTVTACLVSGKLTRVSAAAAPECT